MSHRQFIALVTSGHEPSWFSKVVRDPLWWNKEGLNYNETFAIVANMVNIQTLLVVVATRSLILHQMDVYNVFLHVDLDEEVFMQLTLGFSCGDSQKVILIVLVYIDDLIIVGNNENLIGGFKSYLSTCFYMKNLGNFKPTRDFLMSAEVCFGHNLIDEIIGWKTGWFSSRIKSSIYTMSLIRALGNYYMGSNPSQGIFLHFDSDLTLYTYCDLDWASFPLTRRSLIRCLILSICNSTVIVKHLFILLSILCFMNAPSILKWAFETLTLQLEGEY
ncbi:hypothetical protein CR513_10839, partial [Mucuna pruriens]